MDIVALILGAIPSLISKFPMIGTILTILGSLVVVAQTYVLMTPSKADDAWFDSLEAMPIIGSIIKAVMSFAPIQRK